MNETIIFRLIFHSKHRIVNWTQNNIKKQTNRNVIILLYFQINKVYHKSIDYP